MGVDLTIIGNHSIPFRNKEIESKTNIVDLLNSLKFEESEFLIGKRKLWNSAHLYSDVWGEEFRRRNEEELERCLKIHSWQFKDYEDDNYCSDSKHYSLVGPYGLNLQMNKYFFDISIWVSRYHNWFNTKEDYDVLWRDKWRFIVYKVTNILGGNYVIYLPDISMYSPIDYCFPKEMEEHLQVDIKDLDHLIKVISEKHSKPIKLAEADKMFNKSHKELFVIDKFEDLDKTLKI